MLSVKPMPPVSYDMPNQPPPGCNIGSLRPAPVRAQRHLGELITFATNPDDVPTPFIPAAPGGAARLLELAPLFVQGPPSYTSAEPLSLIAPAPAAASVGKPTILCPSSPRVINSPTRDNALTPLDADDTTYTWVLDGRE